MTITVLLDHDLEGQVPFLEAGWRETGWNQYLHLELIRLRDRNVPNDASDQEILRSQLASTPQHPGAYNRPHRTVIAQLPLTSD
jgi:hypothetical protein